MARATETRWIALVRGINVGKAKRVAMADLRALVEALGYRDVSTLLNSGNVVFTGAGKASAIAPRIERALLERTGIDARVVVLSASELASALDDNPLGEPADPARFLVAAFTDAAAAMAVRSFGERAWAPDRFAVAGRMAWLWCDAGLIESPLAKAFAKAAGEAATARNWTTMTKLSAIANR